MSITDIIGDLLPQSRRDLAYNLFSGFFERNLSANQALQELKDQGLGYRRADFLVDYKTALASYDQASQIRHLQPGKVASDDILEGKYFGVPDKYSILFQYEKTDPTTGEKDTGYMFYHRNSLDKNGNMSDDARDYLESESDAYPFDIGSVKVWEGYINPLWE